MTGNRQFEVPGSPGGPATGDDWLATVATSAASACQAPVELLGGYLPMLADAAIHGRRPDAWELDAVRELGRRAAAQGVGARRAVELYLSAAWRLWRGLPLLVGWGGPEKGAPAPQGGLRGRRGARGGLLAGAHPPR